MGTTHVFESHETQFLLDVLGLCRIGLSDRNYRLSLLGECSGSDSDSDRDEHSEFDLRSMKRAAARKYLVSSKELNVVEPIYFVYRNHVLRFITASNDIDVLAPHLPYLFKEKLQIFLALLRALKLPPVYECKVMASDIKRKSKMRLKKLPENYVHDKLVVCGNFALHMTFFKNYNGKTIQEVLAAMSEIVASVRSFQIVWAARISTGSLKPRKKHALARATQHPLFEPRILSIIMQFLSEPLKNAVDVAADVAVAADESDADE